MLDSEAPVESVENGRKRRPTSSGEMSSTAAEAQEQQLAASLNSSMSTSADLHIVASGLGTAGGHRGEDDKTTSGLYCGIRLDEGLLDGCPGNSGPQDDDNQTGSTRAASTSRTIVPDLGVRTEGMAADDSDDDLRSLDWLLDFGMTNGIHGWSQLSPSLLEDIGVEDDAEQLFSREGEESDNLENLEASAEYSEPSSESATATYSQQHPSHIPYDPLKHVNSKPPYSFSCLIFMAIEDAPDKRLPVKEIYSWILTHFPYFQRAPSGWKNSVRHNLSLNRSFKKVDKDAVSNIGKGCCWCVDPDFRPNLVQALRKTPFYPYHQLQMTSASPGSPCVTGQPKTLPAPRVTTTTLSRDLFPYLSRRLALADHSVPSPPTASLEPDSSDIEAANALMLLKSSSFINSSTSRGAKSRSSSDARLVARRGRVNRRSPSPPEFGSKADRERTAATALAARSRYELSTVSVTKPPSKDHTYVGRSQDDGSCNSDRNDDSDWGADEEDGVHFFNGEDETEMETDRFVIETPGASCSATGLSYPAVLTEREMDAVAALLKLAGLACFNNSVINDVGGDISYAEDVVI